MHAIVALMQSSCKPSSAFVYRSILSGEAEQLLYSIHRTVVPAKTAATTALSVTHSSSPATAATQLLVGRQPGSIMSLGPQVKIIIGTMGMLRSMNACGRDEEEEMADRSRSPSPPHPIFNGPVVR